MTDGLHVPVIPLGDIVPKTGAVVHAQNAGIEGKSGTMGLTTETLIVAGVAQKLLDGVNV